MEEGARARARPSPSFYSNACEPQMASRAISLPILRKDDQGGAEARRKEERAHTQTPDQAPGREGCAGIPRLRKLNCAPDSGVNTQVLEGTESPNYRSKTPK